MNPTLPPAPPPEPGDPAAPAPTPVADPGPPLFRKSGLLFFGALALLFLPGQVAQGLSLAVGLPWTELFGLLLPVYVATAGSNLRVRRYLGLRWPGLAPALLALPLGLAGYAAAQGVALVWLRVFPPEVLDRFNAARLFHAGPVEQVVVTASAVLLAPLCEELAFRGYLQRTFTLRRGPALAVAASAVLFALLHLNPVLFPSLVVLGLVWGWVNWRTGSVWPSIIAHAVNNGLVSGLALALPEQVGAPAAEPPPLAAALVWVVAGTTLLLAFAALLDRCARRPPPAEDALELRDPSDPDLAFRSRRVPPLGMLGISVALAILSGLFWWAARRG
ncbi:MAG: CPBP family intramembrane metalloprotease [Anaeromyxobacter sp.]